MVWKGILFISYNIMKNCGSINVKTAHPTINIVKTVSQQCKVY